MQMPGALHRRRRRPHYDAAVLAYGEARDAARQAQADAWPTCRRRAPALETGPAGRPAHPRRCSRGARPRTADEEPLLEGMCAFDPKHGKATDARSRSPRRAATEADAARVRATARPQMAAGEQPQFREVEQNGRRVPYWQTGPMGMGGGGGFGGGGGGLGPVLGGALAGVILGGMFGGGDAEASQAAGATAAASAAAAVAATSEAAAEAGTSAAEATSGAAGTSAAGAAGTGLVAMRADRPRRDAHRRARLHPAHVVAEAHRERAPRDEVQLLELLVVMPVPARSRSAAGAEQRRSGGPCGADAGRRGGPTPPAALRGAPASDGRNSPGCSVPA